MFGFIRNAFRETGHAVNELDPLDTDIVRTTTEIVNTVAEPVTEVLDSAVDTVLGIFDWD